MVLASSQRFMAGARDRLTQLGLISARAVTVRGRSKLRTVTENTLGEGNTGTFPWELGSATGIGSMPGPDPPESARTVVDELPGFPFLPELPARGPGADLIGRTAALLIGIPVETVPTGWRIAERPGRIMRAAQSMLSSDLDIMEEQLAGYEGPLKLSVTGPWTLAA